MTLFLREMLLVSGAYIVVFSLTHAAIWPAQRALFGESLAGYGLLFLPNGVRVLAAWIYGLRSAALLLPGAAVMHWMLYGADGFRGPELLPLVGGVLLCPALFAILSRIGLPGLRMDPTRRPCWQCVFLGGVAFAVLNALLHLVVRDLTALDAAGFLIGDVFGLLFFLLISIALMRLSLKA